MGKISKKKQYKKNSLMHNKKGQLVRLAFFEVLWVYSGLTFKVTDSFTQQPVFTVAPSCLP
jgi:hypothetical protein